jgi:hypothetical protein
MAIQVNGTEVISNNRALTNVNGLKTVGGTSILGSGDIAAGGGTELINVNVNSPGFTTANVNSLNGGTNGVWGWANWNGNPNSGNDYGNITLTVAGTNSWIIRTDGSGQSYGPGGVSVGVGTNNNTVSDRSGKAWFKLDPGASMNETPFRANMSTNVTYTAI